MDIIIKETVERIENKLYSLKPNGKVVLSVIVNPANLSDLSYLKQLRKESVKYGIEIEPSYCQDWTEAFDAVRENKNISYIYGIMIISKYESAVSVPCYCDVDAQSKEWQYRTYSSNNPKEICEYAPCTAVAAYEIAKTLYPEGVQGKNIAVLGRSDKVGKPLAHILTCADATVTLFHSKSNLPKDGFENYNIICSAIGVPKFLNGDNVSSNHTIIDIGINVDKDNKVCGDCDYESLAKTANYITPVPKGVGNITTLIAFLRVLQRAI